MSEYIVTGRTGQNHVTSADHGAMNASFAGSGRYVAEGIGDTLSAEVVTNNLVRIHSGEVFNQGRHMRVEANTYVDCTIENGSQSKLRYDLIVFRYTKNADTGVENGEIVVIKGTAGTSAADPSYTTGNILAGALQDDMPLYRVKIDGINIVGLDKLFVTVPGLAALNAKVSQLNSDFAKLPHFIKIERSEYRSDTDESIFDYPDGVTLLNFTPIILSNTEILAGQIVPTYTGIDKSYLWDNAVQVFGDYRYLFGYYL